MTTLTVHKGAAASLDALLKQQPSPLPPAILHTEPVEGFRNPQWVARPIAEAQRQDIRAAQMALERRLEPAARQVVIGLLIRLAVQWPEVSKDPQGFGLRVADMADDLAEFSAEQIAATCVEWRKTENWYPKSADLRGKLITMAAYDRMHLRRAKVLLGEEKPRDWETPVVVGGTSNVFNIEEAYQALERGKRVRP